MFRYTVRCTFVNDDRALADQWISWLVEEHADDVIQCGAETAEIVRLDGEPASVEVRYSFANRQAFEAYERDHAPRLRADGMQRFPLDSGLEYERSTGEVVSRAR